MKKKNRKGKIYDTIRKGWGGINPVQKVIKNKKRYNRKRDKKVNENE